jgi:hypothetical protein
LFITEKNSKLHQPTAGHFTPTAETEFLALKTVLIAGRGFFNDKRTSLLQHFTFVAVKGFIGQASRGQIGFS